MDRPYSGYDDIVAMSKVQAGEFPQRPSDGIPDPIWTFLGECWSSDPTKRPSTAQVHGILSRFRPLPPPMEELPRSDNQLTVPIPGARSENSISRAAQSYIDRITEVTQLVASSPSSYLIPVIETSARESKTGGERYHRTSSVV